MEDLKWKPINGFKMVVDGLYEVSNYGDVRYLESRQEIHKKIANKRYHPYYAVSLSVKNSSTKQWILVHQLVATFFCEIPEKYKGIRDLVPDHLDNNGLNNYYKNLEWKTRGENVISAFEKGYCNNSCDNNANSIVDNETVHKICKLMELGKSYDDIISELNLPKENRYRLLLVRIKNGNAWTDISKEYNIQNADSISRATVETVERLPKIIQLMNDGFSNPEIFELLWDSKDKKYRKSKLMTLQLIRKRRIYKDMLGELKV